MGYAQVTANQTGIGQSATDVAGLSVTFTPVAGRRYVTTISWLGQTTSAGAATVVVALIADSANTVVQQRNMTFPLGQFNHAAFVQSEEAGLAATTTVRKARCYTTSGTVDVAAGATYPAFISVEDVGPVTGAPAIANPTPAWITPTLLNGWAHYSVGGAQYRMVGDIVYLRGAIKSGTMGTTAFTLPAGFRPLVLLFVGTLTAGPTYGYYTIDTSGGVVPQAGNVAQVEMAYNFSVTP